LRNIKRYLFSILQDHATILFNIFYFSNTNNYGTSGVIYSTGWPSRYMRSYFSCNHKIQRANGYQGVYVVFMDINMYDSYYSSDDCVQLFGSNSSSYYFTKEISSKLCNTYRMKTYKTYSSYLKIELTRRNRPSYYTYRGFVAGYIMFRTPTTLRPMTTLPSSSPTTIYNTNPRNKPVDEPSSKNSSTVGIVLGVLIPIIIIIVIVVAFIIYNKKKERPNIGATDQAHPQTTTTVSASHQTTAHQTLQTPAPPAYTNLAFSQPQQFYPTTSMQTVIYPTATHQSAYPTAQPYSTGQFTSVGNAPPQYSFVVAPTQGSIPAGTLQPSCAQVIHGQQPIGALNHVSSSFSSATGNAPPSMPSVVTLPSAPPPSYQEVIRS